MSLANDVSFTQGAARFKIQAGGLVARRALHTELSFGNQKKQ